MLSLAWCTETPSITESGLAKYTYSKMHGDNLVFSLHCSLNRFPPLSMNIASPGAKSLTASNPSELRATLSEEMPQE